ncbi:MAG TPA: DUF4013 domain-containing protein [Thermoanaerobaculia bacterium]|jgi:hypothetical protein|nr:DUF4013 domain-containing protein [Thermoanaerobaculia bacterium]
MSDVPYTPPPPPPLPPPAEPAKPSFDFAKPFTFVFDDPEWLQRILIGGLFYLAGFLIVGWFFILGYMAKLMRNVIAGMPRPLPDWENLGDYFNEGLRLFGVAFCYVLPLIVLGIGMMFPAMIADAIDNEGVRTMGGLITGCVACLFVPLTLAVTFFMPASLLFAAVERRFGAAFELRRIWPFIKQNIGNYVLAILVYLIARMIGGVGIFLLCIGVVFTGFWSFLITAHAFAQVYRLATQPRV